MRKYSSHTYSALPPGWEKWCCVGVQDFVFKICPNKNAHDANEKQENTCLVSVTKKRKGAGEGPFALAGGALERIKKRRNRCPYT